MPAPVLPETTRPIAELCSSSAVDQVVSDLLVMAMYQQQGACDDNEKAECCSL